MASRSDPSERRAAPHWWRLVAQVVALAGLGALSAFAYAWQMSVAVVLVSVMFCLAH